MPGQPNYRALASEYLERITRDELRDLGRVAGHLLRVATLGLGKPATSLTVIVRGRRLTVEQLIHEIEGLDEHQNMEALLVVGELLAVDFQRWHQLIEQGQLDLEDMAGRERWNGTKLENFSRVNALQKERLGQKQKS